MGKTPVQIYLNEQGQMWVDGTIPHLPKVIVERLHPDAKIPMYASEGDSGMDVYAKEGALVRPGETVICKIGIAVEIPCHPFHHLGYRWELQARMRSGLSAKTKIRVSNSPGTIDNSFRGEIGIIIENTTQQEYELDYERDEDTGAVHRATMEQETEDGAHDLKGGFVGSTALEHRGLLDWYGIRLPKGTVCIEKGDRIAQLVFAEVIRPLEIVEGTVSTDTDRGTGGFGHTGVGK